MKVHILPGDTYHHRMMRSVLAQKDACHSPTQLHCPSDGFCLGEPEDNALRHVIDAINDYTETLVPGAQLRFLTRLHDDVSARLRVLKT